MRSSDPHAAEGGDDDLDGAVPADTLLDDPVHADGAEADPASGLEAAAAPADAPADTRAPAGRAGTVAPVDEPALLAWIDAIVDHDERALTALYDATLSRVYGLVLRIVRDAALAEEVVEDTYFQVWRQAARFDAERGRALPWLLGMARSRAIDALRREARFAHDTLDDELHEPASEEPEVDDLLAVARGHADLHQALMRLNAQPRQLVALAFFRGLSHEEIATQTALPLGTVKSQIRRALLSLKAALGDAGLQALAS